jgi:hypothetical protein
MAEVVVDPTPIFPHEDIDLFKSNAEKGRPELLHELGQFAVFAKLHMQVEDTLDSEACAQAFTVANGKAGANIFSNKFRFGDFVSQLGYAAPRSVVVEPREIEGGTDYREQIEVLDEQPQRFCKPLYSTRGRGTHIAESSEEALDFAAAQGEPYLVQSLEYPQRDWRYILHRDAVQLSEGEQPGWRIASQKVRPTVVGNGSKSILELVEDHEIMPIRSKRGYIKHHADALKVIPAEGETVELIEAANVAQGAYPKMGTDTETRNLDRFMARFLHDAETARGARLGTLCVDLGVKDIEALTGEYDFEKIKNNLVFYEHQMPFDILYDIPADTTWGAADKFMPRSLHAKYIHRRIQLDLMRSVVRSGKYLQEHETA